MRSCRLLHFAALLFLLAGCVSLPANRPDVATSSTRPTFVPGIEAGLHWRAASVAKGGWVVILPGASGLKIFEDENHYFRVADQLNARGFDVLVVDYKRAYRSASTRPDLPTGEKIAWVLEQAICWAKDERRIADGSPGAVVAWSLGAEALWPTLEVKLPSLGIVAAAAYYPSNENRTPITTHIPLLLFVGEADDVTPAPDMKEIVLAANSPRIELYSYALAGHGFDVASIVPARTVRLFPLIGPSATFAHDPSATADAWKKLCAFLDQHLGPKK